MARTGLTIAGLGGQGSILAGVILGSAAVTYDGKYATQTQAYSSELRGGFAATWVIISEQPIIFPRVTQSDVLVAQAQDSIERFGQMVKSDGILIYDESMVQEPPAHIRRKYKVPATSIARNELKAPVTGNIVILGALCKVSPIVSREAVERAIVRAVPQGKDGLNLRALELGFQNVTRC